MKWIQCFCLTLLFGFSASGAQTNPPSAYKVPPAPAQKSTGTNKVSAAKTAPPAVTPASIAADDKAIDAVMVKFGAAVKSGDLAYAADVMYTPVLNQMGGKQSIIAMARAQQTLMQRQHIGYVSWQAQKPYTYINGTVRRYAVIKYEAVFDAAGKKLKVKNCLLGIKVSPVAWQFIMGDDLNPVFNQQFIPDFPKNVVMPKPQTIQL